MQRPTSSQSERHWLVTESVELINSVAQAQSLDSETQEEIKRQAMTRMADHDPMLYQIMEVKIVSNPRRNFLNISIRKDYLSLIFQQCVNRVYYCFFASDKLEPFVTITAVHPTMGKLRQLSQGQVDDLVSTITVFKNKFGITDETYHYTGQTERQETDRAVREGRINSRNKSHSSHFHLKMRIATAMYLNELPVCGLLNFNKLRETIEPIRYNYSRKCITWDEAVRAIKADAYEN